MVIWSAVTQKQLEVKNAEQELRFPLLEADSQASMQKGSILITGNLRTNKQQIENQAADIF